MTQNNGWSYGGNDGVTDATRPLPNVNGQASYQQGQNAYPQAYASPGYTYPQAATAQATSAQPAPQTTDNNKRYGAGVVLTAALLAALVGGGVGAGVGGGIAASNNSSSSTSSRGSLSSNISNSSTVAGVAETAKKVLPSTVTIMASSGSTSGGGSGVILDKDGHILTNNHVVTLESSREASTIEVRLSDGTVRTATVVGLDSAADLAVLKINPSGLDLQPITWGDSSKLVSGEAVVALGAPYRRSESVTAGVVSNVNRVQPADAKGQNYIPMIQVDVPINHGNSGGPLVNLKGELVGINAQGQASQDGGTADGMAFSITSNYAKRISSEIIAKGKATHGYLGASVKNSPADTGSGSSKLIPGGVEIASVESNSPAAKAGLRSGDVVIEADGHAVTKSEELNGTVRAAAAGSDLKLKVKRGSSTHDITVTLGDADSQK